MISPSVLMMLLAAHPRPTPETTFSDDRKRHVLSMRSEPAENPESLEGKTVKDQGRIEPAFLAGQGG